MTFLIVSYAIIYLVFIAPIIIANRNINKSLYLLSLKEHELVTTSTKKSRIVLYTSILIGITLGFFTTFWISPFLGAVFFGSGFIFGTLRQGQGIYDLDITPLYIDQVKRSFKIFVIGMIIWMIMLPFPIYYFLKQLP